MGGPDGKQRSTAGTMYQILEICGIPGLKGCIGDSQKVIDGHYPHVMPHSSNLSFWEKGMTSDIGHTWLIGHKRLGNGTELGWEGMSQNWALRPGPTHSFISRCTARAGVL